MWPPLIWSKQWKLLVWFVWPLQRNKALNFHLMLNENYCQTEAQCGYHLTKTIGILLLSTETLWGSGKSDIWWHFTFIEGFDFANLIGVLDTRYMTWPHLFISHAMTTADTVYHNTVRMPSGCFMFPWFGHTVDSCISAGTENTVSSPNR